MVFLLGSVEREVSEAEVRQACRQVREFDRNRPGSRRIPKWNDSKPRLYRNGIWRAAKVFPMATDPSSSNLAIPGGGA